MKRLFLLLVVLNLGVFLWLYPRHVERQRSTDRLEPQLGDLRLLSEIEGMAADRGTAARVPAPQSGQSMQPQRDLDHGVEQAELPEVGGAPQPSAQVLPQVAEEDPDASPGHAPRPAGEQAMATAREDEPVTPAEVRPDLAAAPAPDAEAAVAPDSLPQPPASSVAQAESIPAPAEQSAAEDSAGSLVCYRLGPIGQRPQVAKLAQRLQPLDITTEIEEQVLLKDAGYWVIYPPPATSEQAQAKERELRAAGITDLWRIREGDLKDAISLGLFFEKKNADTLKRRLEAKGFKPEIRLRQVEQPVFWLNLRVRAAVATPEQIKAALPRQGADMEPGVVSCPDVVSP